tara:strand:+ start:33241 stop:33819 length:579 start_codon:yes stop_codon:yes gene_type:complete
MTDTSFEYFGREALAAVIATGVAIGVATLSFPILLLLVPSDGQATAGVGEISSLISVSPVFFLGGYLAYRAVKMWKHCGRQLTRVAGVLTLLLAAGTLSASVQPVFLEDMTNAGAVENSAFACAGGNCAARTTFGWPADVYTQFEAPDPVYGSTHFDATGLLLNIAFVALAMWVFTLVFGILHSIRVRITHN